MGEIPGTAGLGQQGLDLFQQPAFIDVIHVVRAVRLTARVDCNRGKGAEIPYLFQRLLFIRMAWQIIRYQPSIDIATFYLNISSS